MKNKNIILFCTILILTSLAQATCENPEAQALAAANAIGILNGLKNIKVSKPALDPIVFGKYGVQIYGELNGFYSHGGDFDITVSDDGFCSITEIKKGLTME